MPARQRPARPSAVCARDTVDCAPETGQLTNGMFVSCQQARVTTGGPAGPRPAQDLSAEPRAPNTTTRNTDQGIAGSS
jgi:hypothetical protein